MLTPEHKYFLNAYIPKVQYNTPLKYFSHFRIGGPAEAIVFPENTEQIAVLLPWLTQETIPWLVIGAGSNILFDDNGFHGIIISLTNCSFMELSDGMIRADAGVSLKILCLHAIRNSLAGMNFALGIPGTLGGAIRMNAGSQGGEISDILESIDCITSDGHYHHIKKDRLKSDYRHICWEHVAPDSVVVRASVLLSQTDNALLRQDARKKMIQRRQTQPIGCACAGSFFKNPSGQYSAGYLIEQAGLKGYHIGDAFVSQKHANFIVNKGHATSREIKELMHYIQVRVHSQFNIQLTPEVKFIHA
ncbi:MAG: UDP-N-acetylmuramate dehydrogenase [Candidatus Magnetomorum sp.]|nr:UDP-N-acetylmuramate dehydrogenase [Candidatus Magnetomorum sp.]